MPVFNPCENGRRGGIEIPWAVRVAASFNCFFLKSFLDLLPCPHFLFCDFRKKILVIEDRPDKNT
jgi:hypothetical protein